MSTINISSSKKHGAKDESETSDVRGLKRGGNYLWQLAMTAHFSGIQNNQLPPSRQLDRVIISRQLQSVQKSITGNTEAMITNDMVYRNR